MKKKTTKKTAHRVPPSVPKCVKKCADGYISDFVTQPNGEVVQFKFKKLDFGYIVLKSSANTSGAINMCNDIRISPSTHKHFSNLKTLKAAIAAVETWLGFPLPEMR